MSARAADGGAAFASAVLEITGVEKAYGRVRACRGVSLSLGAGRILGLLGPNGAGKTTLAHLAVGLDRPSAGTVRVLGMDVAPGRRAVQAAISYMAQEGPAFTSLSPVEALSSIGRLRGMSRPVARARADELLERLELTAAARRPIAVMSGGERQRVALGATVIAPTPLVVLDEPTAALDPGFRESAWRLIRELADAGTAVLLVTHLVAEAAAVVDEVAVMAAGRIRLSGSAADVVASLDTGLRVRAGLDPARLPKALASCRTENGRPDGMVHLRVPPDLVSALLAHLAEEARRGPAFSVEIRPATLEEVMTEWLDRNLS